MKVRLISITKPEYKAPESACTAEELIAYCARVSSGNQDNPDYVKLFKYLIIHGHWSPFEMASMCVEITTSRAISPQILRHKSFSFQEFCISGDSLITTVNKNGTKKIAIKDLYRYQNDARMQVVWDRGIRVYDNASGKLVKSKVKEVFKTGIKTTYVLKTEDGKVLRSTKEHRFLKYKEGFVALENLKVGDIIAVNGEPCYKSKDWLSSAKHKAIATKTGVQGIADEASVSYHTIRKWLKIHGLQFSKKETASMYDIWNKGLDKEKQPRFGKNVSDYTRSKMRDSSKKGIDNNLYINGNSKQSSFRKKVWDWQIKYKNKLLNESNGICAHCGKYHNDLDLEIDHKLPVSTHRDFAFDYTNLQILCKDCHRIKTSKETVASKLTVRWKIITSIELYGDEETYDIEVEHDSHNYIANGICVHNSQRYAEVTDFEDVELRLQGNTKQGSGDVVYDIDIEQELSAHLHRSERIYKRLIGEGVSRETARMYLPLCTQTKLYMNGTVRSWIHYLETRLKDDTQKEHRLIAEEIKQIFVGNFPITSEVMSWE
jgi:thymidylate synthase (FAD)